MLEKIGRPEVVRFGQNLHSAVKIFVGIVGLLGCIFITVRHNKAVHSAIKQSTLLGLSHRHTLQNTRWVNMWQAGLWLGDGGQGKFTRLGFNPRVPEKIADCPVPLGSK